MKILYCCDGSRISTDALLNLKHFVGSAAVDVFCVIDWMFLDTCINCPNQDLEAACGKVARQIVSQAGQSVKKQGFELNCSEQIFGNASEKISEKVKSGEYDLVLMGSSGKKGIRNWLGSVSSFVIKTSKTPVFVSKHQIEAPKALICVDNSSISAAAAEFFAQNFHAAEIGICNVIEENLSMDSFYFEQSTLLELQKNEEKHAKRAIEETKQILEKHHKHVHHQYVLNGNVAEKILELAHKENYGLIVVGKHKKSFLDGIFIGSISKRILDNFSGAVLIYPTSQRDLQ